GAPRIAAEGLITSASRKHDLDEPAREPSNVVVRVGLADAQVFEMVDECRKAPHHVSGLHNRLVLLGAELVGHRLRALPLVPAELETRRRSQVEPASKRGQVRKMCGSDCRDASGVDSATKVCPDRY